jgi:hypothetical protein
MQRGFSHKKAQKSQKFGVSCAFDGRIMSPQGPMFSWKSYGVPSAKSKVKEGKRRSRDGFFQCSVFGVLGKRRAET